MNSIEQPSNQLPIDYLIDSRAFRVDETPTFGVSGNLLIYYISTENLCGGKEQAKKILDAIDITLKTNPLNIASAVLPLLIDVYENSFIYKEVIDKLVMMACKQNPDFISGGERRDWIFAPIVAKFMKLECIYLTKDGRAISNGGYVNYLPGKTVHVADLITVGSSYTDVWIPVVNNLGSSIKAALNVVDRQEGGECNLNAAGIEVVKSLYKIDETIFEKALEKGILNEDQAELARAYLVNPDETMRNFLLNNPDFLKGALLSSERKIVERATKLVQNNLYDLPAKYIADLEL